MFNLYKEVNKYSSNSIDLTIFNYRKNISAVLKRTLENNDVEYSEEHKKQLLNELELFNKSFDLYYEVIFELMPHTLNYNVFYDFSYRNEFVESINSFIIFPQLFETVFNELGRIPTLEEYQRKGLELVKEKFENLGGSETKEIIFDGKKIEWNEEIIKGFHYRISKTYSSMVTEKIVELYLQKMLENKLIPDMEEVIVSDMVDTVMGVDVVVRYNNEDRVRYSKYIHILSDSNLSRKYFNIKNDRDGILFYNDEKEGEIRFYYERPEWTNTHEQLFFNSFKITKERYSLKYLGMNIPNPYYIFDLVYIREFDFLFEDIDLGEKELKHFNDWLIEMELDNERDLYSDNIRIEGNGYGK